MPVLWVYGMKAEPGRATMAEQVEWRLRLLRPYPMPRRMLARGHDLADRIPKLPPLFGRRWLAAAVAQHRNTERPEGSGAPEHGEPGRTLAAACPSHITQLQRVDELVLRGLNAADPDWRAD